MTRGEHMRRCRESAGYLIKDLAAEAGVAPGTISHAERDLHCPSIDTVEILADILGLSIDEYVGHEVVKINA